ncbi:signal peptidase I [Sphingosinicella sp. YJ22]|uniref:signal peptidase I n=1 Tax=Sphingosinicella sp. YJ22 TaxID=1104780 RepID=UPI001FAF6631|nr:signal peptidase I [Sphingosinicella sp. YJ22]
MASESDKAAPAAEQAPVPSAAETPPEKQEKESIWSFLRFLLILGVVTLLVRSLLFAPFSIPSGSMLPNLMIGDYLFVSKWPYGYSRYSFPFGIAQFDGRIMSSLPERGDIAVFRYPGPRNEDFVKRVIGLPGDTIEVRGGATILNGQPVQRQAAGQFVVPVSENSPCSPYPGSAARLIAQPDGTPACSYPLVRETLPGGRSFDTIDQFPASEGDNVAQFTVPEGHVFVMGDNRDDSLDGRFPVARGGVGLLPLENLQGRALISFWSTDGSAAWLLPWTWFSAARWSRIGMTYP